MYQFHNSENCDIKEKGCEYISKANWRYLTYINLGHKEINIGSNNIGDKGYEYISKANWISLDSIRLGIRYKNIDNNNISNYN